MKNVLSGVLLTVVMLGLVLLVIFSPLGLVSKKLIAVAICLAGTWVSFKYNLWRIVAIGLLCHTVVGGLLIRVPKLNIVNESIRNLYYHVPMWFAMIIILFASVWYSVKYLKHGRLEDDIKASEGAYISLVLGLLGLVTGMIWANFTWGKPWHGDPKQMATLIGLLMYAAYAILRGAFQDDTQRARISAIYNIFAFPTLIVLIGILPRLAKDSLHPGNGGNPAFGNVDDIMIIVFYPAIIAWTLLGVWIAWVRVRIKLLYAKKNGIL